MGGPGQVKKCSAITETGMCDKKMICHVSSTNLYCAQHNNPKSIKMTEYFSQIRDILCFKSKYDIAQRLYNHEKETNRISKTIESLKLDENNITTQLNTIQSVLRYHEDKLVKETSDFESVKSQYINNAKRKLESAPIDEPLSKIAKLC
jgi:hypothetical protein